MAFKSETETRKTAARVDMSWDNAEFDEPKSKRDWKRFFLVFGLGALSWVATYVGMLELIEANMGDLPLIHKAIIGFSVAMLMVMVVWLLDQMFSDIGWFTRILFGAGYVFLTLISVGFGFGFYWKVLESRSEASRSAESAVGQVQTSLHAAMTRLEQLQGTLDSLTNVSTTKADTERASGTSCPNSKPGDGPRRKMRDDDAGRFKFASDFVKGRVTTVKTDIAALEGDLAKIVKDDKSTVDAKSGNRNEFMRNLGRKLDMTVVGFNAFRTDPQLKQIRADLHERADKVTFVDTKGGTYTCPDSQLTTALKGVVRAIDELPSLEKPKIAAVEGSEAVIEAFRRLTATFYGALSFKLPPSPEELRELQKKAVQSVEMGNAAQAKLNAMADQAGLSKRDYVPLAIALFVDICLLLVSMKKAQSRLGGLLPKMRAAERGPVIQILSRFNEIHHDKQIRENFEVFRHVVFDFHGDYYAAVPLNAPYRPNPNNGRQRQGYGVSDAEALIQEAHLLANLFASFEKEKIFTRVHSPLLGTKTVQKRLRRQGSKFANSEAFRIYRFRDGAWSDIILGAVMGAARRVEEDKRRRRVEDEIFRNDKQPTLDPRSHPDDGYRPPANPDDLRVGRPARGEPHMPYVVGNENDRGAAVGYRRPSPPQGMETGTQDGRGPAGPVPGYAGYPASVQGGQHRAASAQASAAPRTAGWIPTPGRRVEQPAQSAINAAPAYSMTRQPAPWPRPAERPANSNTAPVDRPEAPSMHAAASAAAMSAAAPIGENIVLHPAMRAVAPQAQPEATNYARPMTEGTLAVAMEPVALHKEPTVTVAAVRETVTYTLPVSDAALPQALFLAAAERRAAVVDAMVETVESVVAEAPKAAPAQLSALPPPMPVAPVVANGPVVISLPDAAAEHAAKAERAAWETAHNAGFDADQDAALDHQSEAAADDADDPRTMAMRLAPKKRDA